VFLNAGTAWRAPAPNELYSDGIHQGVSAIERGKHDLKTETCYNITLSGIYRTKKFNAELTAYHNSFKNFIYLQPSQSLELTIRGAFPVFNYVQADARISGLDLKTEYSLTNKFSVLLRGMLVRGWNQSINDYLIYMPGDRGDAGLKFKLPDLKIIKDWYIQINNSFVAKQWRVPALGDFSPAPDSYYLLGAALGGNFKFGRQLLYVNFSVTNLLNARYREYLDRFRYYSNAQGRSYNLRLTMPLTFYKKKPSQNEK
jgi:iron complex outermembrane receptor protein